MEAPHGRCEPTPLREMVALFSVPREPWWIAGGHAVELEMVGRRPARSLRLRVAGGGRDPATRRPQLWCRPRPWRVQLMLDESQDGQRAFRRDPGARRPFATVAWFPERVPCLAPDVQLHDKAKAPRPKGGADFATAGIRGVGRQLPYARATFNPPPKWSGTRPRPTARAAPARATPVPPV